MGKVVICAGGAGIPTMYDPEKERTLVGVEAVIDKDRATELLARERGRICIHYGHRRGRRVP